MRTGLLISTFLLVDTIWSAPGVKYVANDFILLDGTTNLAVPGEAYTLSYTFQVTGNLVDLWITSGGVESIANSFILHLDDRNLEHPTLSPLITSQSLECTRIDNQISTQPVWYNHFSPTDVGASEPDTCDQTPSTCIRPNVIYAFHMMYPTGLANWQQTIPVVGSVCTFTYLGKYKFSKSAVPASMQVTIDGTSYSLAGPPPPPSTAPTPPLYATEINEVGTRLDPTDPYVQMMNASTENYPHLIVICAASVVLALMLN